MATTVYLWSFETVRRQTFSTVDWDPKLEASKAGLLAVYTTNQTYATPKIPRSRADLFVNYAGDNLDTISYKVLFTDRAGVATEPGDFLVDSKTGATLAYPSTTGHYIGMLAAVDNDGDIACVPRAVKPATG